MQNVELILWHSLALVLIGVVFGYLGNLGRKYVRECKDVTASANSSETWHYSEKMKSYYSAF